MKILIDIEEQGRADTLKKVRRYRELNRNALKGQIVMAGSSLMENFPITEMLMSRRSDKIVYNRALSALSIGLYDEFLDCVLDLEPSKIFINIGTNDLSLPGDTIGNLITNYRAMLNKIHTALPDCKIVMLAYYPTLKEVCAAPPVADCIARTKENVDLANAAIEKLAAEFGFGFLNLNAAISTPEGLMIPEFAEDDIHFSPAGYERVLDLLEPYL